MKERKKCKQIKPVFQLLNLMVSHWTIRHPKYFIKVEVIDVIWHGGGKCSVPLNAVQLQSTLTRGAQGLASPGPAHFEPGFGLGL